MTTIDWDRLLYPETRAALAQAERLGRLTARQLGDAGTEFDSLSEEIDLVEVDDVPHSPRWRAGRSSPNSAGMTQSTLRLLTELLNDPDGAAAQRVICSDAADDED